MKTTIIFIVTFLTVTHSRADNTNYYIWINDVSSDPQRTDAIDTVYAGAAYTLQLKVLANNNEKTQEYTGLQETCPPWLSIEVAELNPFQSYTPISENLHLEMKIRYYLDAYSMAYDRMGSEASVEMGLHHPRYHFYVEFPHGLAGKTVRLVPQFDPPPYGPVIYNLREDMREAIVYVKAPATENEAKKAQLLKAENLLASHQLEACLSLVDSGISLGYIELADQGKNAATQSQNWEKAISYLDTLYNTFGKTTLNRLLTPGPPDAQKAIYLKLRESYIENLNKSKPTDSPK